MEYQDFGEQNEVVEEVKMNGIQKVFGMIFSPGEAFKSIVAKPGILLPIIIMVISSLLVIVVQSDLYYETTLNTLQKTYKLIEQKQGITIDPNQIVTQVNSTTSVFGKVKIAIYSLGIWLVMTAFYFLLLKKIMKGNGKFKQFLSVTGYIATIGLLSAIINLCMSYVTGKMEQDLSLAIFTDSIIGNLKNSTNFIYGFTYGALKSFGIFDIWKAVLLAIGMKKLTNLSSSKINTVVIVFFVLGLIVSAVVLGVSEMLTGVVSSTMAG